MPKQSFDHSEFRAEAIRAVRFLPENVVYVFESLFEHEEKAAKETYPKLFSMRRERKDEGRIKGRGRGDV